MGSHWKVLIRETTCFDSLDFKKIILATVWETICRQAKNKARRTIRILLNNNLVRNGSGLKQVVAVLKRKKKKIRLWIYFEVKIWKLIRHSLQEK